MANEPRFPRPKVLLVDFDDEVTAATMDAGYRVASGTLGTPFRVPQADGFVRLPSSLRVPNFAEQEVVFVQQAQRNSQEAAPTPPPETGENAVWARTRSGLVDPRPWGAFSVADQAQRILDHGGAFVIFCAPRESTDLVWGRPWAGRLDIAEELDWTVWSLLPSLADVWVTTDFGLEIDTGSLPEQLAVLEPFIRTARFACTLDVPGYLKNRWLSVARNKYGSTVAAVLGPEEESRGWILLLPQVEEVSACILALLESVLPTLTPRLFPHTEHVEWLHEAPYELPAIISLQREIARVREEAQAEESRLQDAIAAERAAHEWLHRLLTGTDDELVEAVAHAFKELGLRDVRKLDDESEDRIEGRRREDIQIWGRSPTLLVEVKGIAGLPTEADSMQVIKYLVPRMRQWDRTDVAALAVINQQRALPALQRQNTHTFQDDVLANAEHQGFGLLTTLDLFRLVRNKTRWAWPDETVADLFYSHGRISAIPSHYTLVGVVDGFFERAEAVCIRVTGEEFAVGDRVAFILPIEYLEHPVESIQQDNAALDRAPTGSRVGVKTVLSKQQARNGVLVYRVESRGSQRQAPAEDESGSAGAA